MGRSEAYLSRWTNQELEAKPPVNEEEKISKEIHVRKDSSIPTWFFRCLCIIIKDRAGWK